jgi:hypothetical protein
MDHRQHGARIVGGDSPLNYNFLFFGSFYQLFRKFATERMQFRLFIEN